MAVIQLKKNAEIDDLISLMMQHIEPMTEQAKYFYANFFDPNDAYVSGKLIFDYLKSLTFKADGKKQKIKSPYRLAVSKIGDCKSFSMFAAAMLLNMGYQVRFVFTADLATGPVNHVFVQYAGDGEIYTLDATICCFDKLPPYKQIFYSPWMQ